MKKNDRRKCPRMPDNAEESIKCKQCGNMFGVSGASAEEMVCCPVCGASMSIADSLRTSASNEDY
ncbi:MAG: hypothetical protein PWR07_2000 [Bacillota bacterium]|nr:hypothetical protein [Bacillota bacterium]MDI6638591.1 hypothetical protein [Bacillota bacterium]MDK2931869.1 hypothetical protein [Bacillota bacterium]